MVGFSLLFRTSGDSFESRLDLTGLMKNFLRQTVHVPTGPGGGTEK